MVSTDSAIILAGGRSLRMGFDKQLLRLNDEYLLAKNLALLLEIFPQVIVVSNDARELQKIPHIQKVTVVGDVFPGRGPLAGIHAGLLQARADFAFVLAVDMPVLDRDYILKMKQLMTEASSVDGLININPAGEPEPFFAFYGRHLVPELEEALNREGRSLRRFIDSHSFIRLPYPGSGPREKDIFININDKKELRDFQELENPSLEKLSKQGAEDAAPVLLSLPLIRYKGSHGAELQDDVITEAKVDLRVNGELYQTMYCTPKDLKELILGNLYAQGRIGSAADLLDIAIRRQTTEDLAVAFAIDVIVREEEGAPAADCAKSRQVTASGPSQTPLPVQGSMLRADVPLTLDLLKIMELSAAFQDTSALFARTGGSHSCALIEDGVITAFMEDIGRHNALDKLMGKALLERKNLAQAMILLSGRMSSEMVNKVLRTPVSALLSRAAPTSRSVQLARQNNLTLIGFIRGQRLNIYHLNRGHTLKNDGE